tara:strand:- start:17003 stop:17605 length:603 start_codon:yes stop_codon:yes gene_type:complete
MSSFFISLTGGIGSGKTTVTRLFEKYHIHCIDTDDIAREVVQPGTEALQKIVQHFSSDVLSDDGSLNRKELRKLIFNQEQERLWINNLLHPLIKVELLRQAKNAPSIYTILVVPLLIESGWHNLASRTLVIDVSEAIQKQRAMARDHACADDIEKIIKTQVTRSERLKHADDVIHNNGTILELEEQVVSLDKQYRLMAKQ